MTGEWELKKQIVEIGKRMWMKGYVASNDGNITVLLNENELLTTPTGVSKGFMTTEMIVKCDRNGKVIYGHSKYKPSSEVKMHLEVYKERPDIKSVVHAHPPYATSFAVAGIPLDKCVLPEAIIIIGAVPIAPYGLPSTMEIPDNIRPFVKNSDAILLQNHGALTFGNDLLNAYYKMETLEHTANIIWNAIQLGNLGVLPQHERDRLMALRSTYNLTGHVTMCNAAQTPKSSQAHTESKQLPKGINEQTIHEITEQILSKLKRS